VRRASDHERAALVALPYENAHSTLRRSSIVAGIIPDKLAASELKEADRSARVGVQELMPETWGGATIRAASFPILHFRLPQLLLVAVNDHRSTL
jgi:hypothetical protein